jgi:thiamine biosynthesis protein ThiS
VKISVNGAERDTAAADITSLVAELGLTPDQVAVERNALLVPRRKWPETLLEANDRIEIVHFVGGGLA